METLKNHSEAAGAKQQLAGQKALAALAEAANDGAVDTTGRKYQGIAQVAAQITPENTREYNTDRRHANLQMLSEKAPDLAELYKNLMAEFPELGNVELMNFDTKRETKSGKPNAAFGMLQLKDGQYRPAVRFNFHEPEVYFDGNEGDGDALALAQSVKKIALSVGVDANEALKNRKFMTSFLLLHEFGHALDFKRNYLDAQNGNLKNAYILNRENRRRDEMTLPMPGTVEVTNPKEDTDTLIKRFSSRFGSMGIRNFDQLKLVNTRKYREMHSERMADDFARDYVLRHYSEFFTQAENPPDGKLSTKFEKPIPMGEDFSEVLGLEEGTRLRFTLLHRPDHVTGKRQIGDTITGYLHKTATLGQPLWLQETNDPQNPGKIHKISHGIKNVSVIPHARLKKDANGQEQRYVGREVRFEDADGRIFQIEKARDQAKTIAGNTPEMLKSLNETFQLKAGSEVQVLKREVVGRDASPIQEGELFMGQLLTDGVSSDGIKLALDDGGKLTTSFIDSIYREWKTFYINTATSTYEVIPVRDQEGEK